MTWQVLIFISIFFASFSTILQRILSKDDKSDPIAYSILFQILTGALIGSFGLFFGQMSFPNLGPILANLVLMAILYGFGNIFVFKALKFSEASLFTIIFSSRAIFTILGSTLLLSEGLTSKQILGAVMIISSMVLVTYKSTKISFGKGEMLALVAAALFGFAVTNDRYLLNHMRLYPYLVTAFVVPAFLMASIYPKNLAKMKIFLDKRTLGKMALLCGVYALSAITFYSALQIGNNSSQVATTHQVNTVLTILLSIFLLKEKENLYKKILGGVLGFIGLLLVS